MSKSLREKFAVKAGSKVDLDKIDPNGNGGLTKEEGLRLTAINLARIAELQELLYAEHKQALLIVLQAMDAGGKDGTVKVVAGAMNPQGVHITSFKSPTRHELDHDFLWRVHNRVPAKGEVAVFNRSHYEEVLIVRVHGLVPEDKWKKRYDQINDFERMLTENGTHILKFFLHIDKDEQLARLKERLDTPGKNWKLSELDFSEREKWDEYQEAYEDALSKCSTDPAPWYIVPANRKWYRNYVISQIVVEKLEELKMRFPDPVVDPEEIRRKHFPKNAVNSAKPQSGP